MAPSWSEVRCSECISPSHRDSQRRNRMEVLKEKVEEEEEAEREEAAERAEKGEKMMRPSEMQKEEIMTQEMIRDLEKKLSEIEIMVPEKPS